VKICEVMRATFPRAVFFLDLHRKAMCGAIQTFNLAIGNRRRIRRALLDRFLACMKPASITERQPCAGVFFFSDRWLGHLAHEKRRAKPAPVAEVPDDHPMIRPLPWWNNR
jgi:hypothetical protein